MDYRLGGKRTETKQSIHSATESLCYLQLYNPSLKLWKQCFSRVAVAVFSLYCSHDAILILFFLCCSHAITLVLLLSWPCIRYEDLQPHHCPSWLTAWGVFPFAFFLEVELLETMYTVSYRPC